MWSWTAALLNHLPANRGTATALDALLKMAGFSMHQRYRQQFAKLLAYVGSVLLRDLCSGSTASDTGPVAVRLGSYISERKFLQPPEGRDMPMLDESRQSLY